MTALIVFSHLRWGFVYQRPQHLMSALAERLPILFVEEPVHTAGAPHTKLVVVGSAATAFDAGSSATAFATG